MTTRAATPSMRMVVALVLFCLLFPAAINNVLWYSKMLREQRRESQIRRGAAAIADGDSSMPASNVVLRRRFYKLLEQIGRDISIQRRETAVIVMDPAFEAGEYIDKPTDTILQSCAIQPFTIPALTGMPLLGVVGKRDSQCKFNAYAYQYLSLHDETSDSQPCSIAKSRGFKKLISITLDGERFSVERLDCADQ